MARWENLGALADGDQIQVVRTDLKSWTGYFVSTGADAISIRTGKGLFRKKELTVARRETLRVSRLTRGRNAPIGAAMGTGAGLAITAGMQSRLKEAGVYKGFHGFVHLAQWGPRGGCGLREPSHQVLYRADPAESGRQSPNARRKVLDSAPRP